MKNGFSYGAVILWVVGLVFLVWALLLPGAAGGLLAAALACGVVGALIWTMAARLGVFVYRGGKVAKQGIRAEAKVLGVLDEADVVLNGNPILELELRVSPQNKEPFTTTVRQVVPRAHADRVRTKGARVPVRIDPADRRRVVLDVAKL